VDGQRLAAGEGTLGALAEDRALGVRRDGQPVSTATWYLWDDGRVLVNMDEGRKRLEHMRHDPRVALDRLARHYTGHRYPQRDRGRISAWIAAEGWHAWGALKDSTSQPG
jgi:hypothetical protein